VPDDTPHPSFKSSGSGSAGEVLLAFGKLGLTAFGGPIAHLGYFRTEFVQRRGWLDDPHYADLVAVCQFLPGPASSQVGFAIGWLRAGPLGAAAAWLGFTLPSALLMLSLAYGADRFNHPMVSGALEGLKIAAVAIVTHAVWGMARNLTPDIRRGAVALLAISLVYLLPGFAGQVCAIAVGGLIGTYLLTLPTSRMAASHAPPIGPRTGVVAGVVFVTLLVVLPGLSMVFPQHSVVIFDAFYRTGALVFGGGHVVLPLLDAALVETGRVSEDAFLIGYGAAQAVPGPLFTLAAYLGAIADPQAGGWVGAGLALIAIFLPGLLLVICALPFLSTIRNHKGLQRAMAGANAAVVGILAAALYDPVFTSAIASGADLVLAALCLTLLLPFRTPPLIVVLIAAAGGIALNVAGG